MAGRAETLSKMRENKGAGGRPCYFVSLVGLVAERLDRLDFERFQANEEHTSAAAACVAAAVRGRIIELGYAREPTPGAGWRRIEDSHVL